MEKAGKFVVLLSFLVLAALAPQGLYGYEEEESALEVDGEEDSIGLALRSEFGFGMGSIHLGYGAETLPGGNFGLYGEAMVRQWRVGLHIGHFRSLPGETFHVTHTDFQTSQFQLQNFATGGLIYVGRQSELNERFRLSYGVHTGAALWMQRDILGDPRHIWANEDILLLSLRPEVAFGLVGAPRRLPGDRYLLEVSLQAMVMAIPSTARIAAIPASSAHFRWEFKAPDGSKIGPYLRTTIPSPGLFLGFYWASHSF